MDALDEMRSVIKPVGAPRFETLVSLKGLERFLASTEHALSEMGGGVELAGGHGRTDQWSESAMSAYVEAWLRRGIELAVTFNCRGWGDEASVAETGSGDLAEHVMHCVDGLQRMQSLRAFMRGAVTVFGRWQCGDLAGTEFDPGKRKVLVRIFSLEERVDLMRLRADLSGAQETVGGTKL